MSSDLNGSQAQAEHNGREIIKNINLILGNSLNLSALNLESKTFKENEAQESSEDALKTKDKRKENSYLHALLGLNNNSERASGIHTGGGMMSDELRNSPSPAIETNSTAGAVNENGKTRLAVKNNPDRTRKESVPLSGRDRSRRMKSMDFNWPIGDNGGMRPRSVSFCDAQLGYKAAESCSPTNYSRPHSSEAGSPTLEQVLLMGRSPESYRSYSSESCYNSFEDFTRSINGDGANYKSEPRPTLASLHEIDVAVAQAVQNLQTLQEKRASVYANLGGLSGSTSRDVPSPPQENAGDLNNNNNNNNINNNNNNSSSDRNNNFSSPPPTASLRSCRRPVTSESKPWHRYNEPMSLEKAARAYRSAATVYDANYTWSGQLPPRARGAGRNPTYSSKIFLGGVPWDITEHSLVMAFADFGQVRVEWPGRDANSPPRGYLYLVFEDEESVRDLLTHCTYDYSNGGSYYYKISSRRMRSKEVQIIPWVITDSNFVRCPSPRLDSQMTVFVGALHGMINAEGLAIIFNDLFDGVIYAGLDTDKHKYPIGSGRVTFSNATSYMKAVAAAFIEVKTPRFCKKIQVDPYVEDSLCSTCGSKQGPYFCRDLSCFKYFCKSCWEIFHTAGRSQHIPMMRIIRSFPARRHDNFRSTDYRNGQSQVSYGAIKNDSAAASDLPRAQENNQGKSQEMEISQRLCDLSLDVFLRNVLGKTPVDEDSNTLVETATKETKK